MGEKLSVELKRISDTLSHSGASTAAYGQALSKISGKLGQTDDVAALKTMVSGLVSATKVMESQSRQLEDRLKQSNAEVQQLQQQLSKINKEALTDALTGLANRRCFDITLKNAVLEAIEKKESLCLIMCDIDHFKRFNDTWGHQMGDQVLRLVARCLSDNVKGRDTAARYGGEEFAVILPATTPENARNLGSKSAARSRTRRSSCAAPTKPRYGRALARLCGAAAGRKLGRPDRTRGCVPLCRQARRAQSRRFRYRP